MPAAGRDTTVRNAVCPFCSLLCDDLSLTERHGRVRVESNGCRRAALGYAYAGGPASPRVHGRPATLDEALARAARILRSARQPLIGGLGSDVRGCQAALALAEQCGAIVDHMHGAAAMSNTSVLQSRGWMLTTLTELRNRADLIVLVGTDTGKSYPRFFERCVWPRNALSASRLRQRQVVYIGKSLRTAGGVSPDGRRPLSLPCADGELPELLAALRALQHGRSPAVRRPLTRARTAVLRAVAERLRSARYAVIVWSAAELDRTHRDLVVHEICELVTALNESTRCSGLALGGSDGGASAINVTAWQTGYPGRVSYAGRAPQYDPELFATGTTLAARAADALLWISSFETDARLPSTEAPIIALTRPSRRVAQRAEVYIPVGTPGVDHAGTLFRTDAVVSLPLRAVRHAPAPAVHEILSRLGARI